MSSPQGELADTAQRLPSLPSGPAELPKTAEAIEPATTSSITIDAKELEESVAWFAESSNVLIEALDSVVTMHPVTTGELSASASFVLQM